MRARASAALVRAIAATAVAAPPAAAQIPPRPPPFAFRTATLVRADHTIEVRMIAAADVTVTVVIMRGTVRLGVGRQRLGPGTTVVPVRIGPRGMRPLREGLHVKLAMYYGPPEPVRANPALLIDDGEPAPPMTA